MAEMRTKMVHALDVQLRSSTRRDFLQLVAMGGMGVLLPAAIAGCSSDPVSPTVKALFNFGTDRGALNLAFGYAQFMADFYARVTSNVFIGMTANETVQIATISGHKGAQRDALQNLITSGRITDALLFNFASVDFSSRANVMGAAQTFEDLGVAALNGAANTVTDATNVILLGKVVSVWARHAAVIRDLNDQAAIAANTAGASRNSFAASADAEGLDPATVTSSVFSALQPYFRTTLTSSGS